MEDNRQSVLHARSGDRRLQILIGVFFAIPFVALVAFYVQGGRPGYAKVDLTDPYLKEIATIYIPAHSILEKHESIVYIELSKEKSGKLLEFIPSHNRPYYTVSAGIPTLAHRLTNGESVAWTRTLETSTECNDLRIVADNPFLVFRSGDRQFLHGFIGAQEKFGRRSAWPVIQCQGADAATRQRCELTAPVSSALYATIWIDGNNLCQWRKISDLMREQVGIFEKIDRTVQIKRCNIRKEIRLLSVNHLTLLLDLS